MINSQGTQVQRWNKRQSGAIILLLILVNIGLAAVAVLYCPELFQVSRIQGGHCSTGSRIPREQTSTGDCNDDCLVRNCDLHEDEETLRLSDITMSFKFPRNPDLSVWQWRAKASLDIQLKIIGVDTASILPLDVAGPHADGEVSAVSFQLPVEISASLDYAPNVLLFGTTKGHSNQSDGSPENLSSAWHSRAIVRHINRTLSCQYVVENRPLGLLNGEAGDVIVPETNLLCSLNPLLEIAPLSNTTYIISIQLHGYQTDWRDQMGLGSDAHLLDMMQLNVTAVSHLTVVTEADNFHVWRFYTKCLFTPLVLMSLVWFMVRICSNDLYVNIPDRLLITASLAQIIANVPTELVVANIQVSYLLLVDPIAHIVLCTMLALFWAIFTLDKLADNEPWERTTRYYWRSVSVCVIVCGMCVMSVLYLELPPHVNPFHHHWQAGILSYVSLGLLLFLGLVMVLYQSCFFVIFFRVTCDISVHYPSSSRAWRLKGVLVYMLLVSTVLSLGMAARAMVTLALHWNPQLNAEPLPFHLNIMGSFYLAELVTTNIHLIFLLLGLSRAALPAGHARPVLYSPVEQRPEQIHLWDLSVLQPGPLQDLSIGQSSPLRKLDV